MQTAAFYFLAFTTILFAVLVITARNPIYSVLYLVLVFFGISANYLLLLAAPFIGIVNIIVYAGAIMVLFLYVIMLMNLNETAEVRKKRWFLFGSVATAGLLLLLIGTLIARGGPEALPATVSDIGTVHALGRVLFTDYILPFELASVLFLVAIVGAVLLARPVRSKTQIRPQ